MMFLRVPRKALVSLGLVNWILIQSTFAEPLYDEIGKHIEDDEEAPQCSYFWELDVPISLASCV